MSKQPMHNRCCGLPLSYHHSGCRNLARVSPERVIHNRATDEYYIMRSALQHAQSQSQWDVLRLQSSKNIIQYICGRYISKEAVAKICKEIDFCIHMRRKEYSAKKLSLSSPA